MTPLASWLFVIETFLVLYLFWKLMLWVCELVEWARRERKQAAADSSGDAPRRTPKSPSKPVKGKVI